jgi:DNA gyrase/topoisomerase IV subunit B
MNKIKDDIIDALTPYQQARARPGMWFGSETPNEDNLVVFNGNELEYKNIRYTPAIATMFREIVDNSLDEISKGFGNVLKLNYNPTTFTFSVLDNGRGIPLDKVQLVFTSMFSGRNFRERGEQAGQNGVGAAVAAFTSLEFTVDVWRDGKHLTQKFSESKEKGGDFGPENIIIHEQIVKPYKGKNVGTQVTLTPSGRVYKHLLMPEEYLKARAWEIAANNPNIKVYWNDELLKSAKTTQATLFSNKKPIVIEITEPDFNSVFYLQPHFAENLDEEVVHSSVNNIPAWDKAGKHISAFRNTFYNGLLEALKLESKRRKLNPNRSDIAAGLLIYNVTKMKAPTFDSQNKTRLTNVEAERAIKKNLDGEVEYKKIIKQYPEWIDDIYARCSERTQKLDNSEAAKLAKKMRKAKVAGLLDATGSNRTFCRLLIGEGDSAVGMIAPARDPKIHGGLALKGKPLNVFDKTAREVLENDELRDICNAIGLIPGQKAVLSDLRYGQVWFATDMDHDGSHICGLLTNFFYKWWPELFDDKKPYFYAFMTPFIIAEKGKQKSYWYGDNVAEFKPEEYRGWNIRRAKGLGSLEESDWVTSLKNPKLIPISDDGRLGELMSLIFNNERADDRKVWLAHE